MTDEWDSYHIWRGHGEGEDFYIDLSFIHYGVGFHEQLSQSCSHTFPARCRRLRRAYYVCVFKQGTTKQYYHSSLHRQTVTSSSLFVTVPVPDRFPTMEQGRKDHGFQPSSDGQACLRMQDWTLRRFHIHFWKIPEYDAARSSLILYNYVLSGGMWRGF